MDNCGLPHSTEVLLTLDSLEWGDVPPSRPPPSDELKDATICWKAGCVRRLSRS